MPESTPFIPKESGAFRTSRLVVHGGAWLFTAALVLILAAAVAAGGLFFYRRALAASRAQWLEQVNAQEAELKPELLSQLTALTSSFSVIRELLTAHTYTSNALAFIESVTHPFVYFSNLTFSRDAHRVELNGLARSYQTVAEQVSNIEAHPQVEQVEFGGLSRGEAGLVNFKLAIVFKPSLLLLRSK